MLLKIWIAMLTWLSLERCDHGNFMGILEGQLLCVDCYCCELDDIEYCRNNPSQPHYRITDIDAMAKKLGIVDGVVPTDEIPPWRFQWASK